jgi:hypothetical protein
MIFYDVHHARPEFISHISSNVSGSVSLEGSARHLTLENVAEDLFTLLGEAIDVGDTVSWTAPHDVYSELRMLLAEYEGEMGSKG